MEKKLQRPADGVVPSICERIKYPNFHLRVHRKGGDLLVSGKSIAVIDKDANTNSAIRRAQQAVSQQLAGFVTAKDEVLKI
jgi:hypothetical protein